MRPGRQEQLTRLVEAGPVLVAVLFHGLSHGRLFVALPAAAAVGWMLLFRAQLPAFTRAGCTLFGVAGALAGLLLTWPSPPPHSTMPAPLLSAICGLLLFDACYSAVTRNALYAWMYAWLLAVLSSNGDPGAALYVTLCALGAATLAAALAQGRIARSGRAGVLASSLFAVALAGTAVAGARAIKDAEGVLVEAVGGAIYRLVESTSLGGLGLQEVVTLQRNANGFESPRPLFELSGEPVERLRAVVLDSFDGDSWTTSAELSRRREPLPSAVGAGPRVELVFFEELGGKLPAPAGTLAVEGARAVLQGGWVVRAEELRHRTVRLQARPDELLPPEELPGAATRQLPDALRAELLPLTEPLVAGLGADRERARTVERFFRENFDYSLTADLQGRGHALTVLVRERRPAYCVYFAGAMAAMLRSVGIPSRMVGGFVVGERNPLDGRALIRQRDAHAWVEVWLADERRWAAFDPTPMDRRDAQLGVDRTPGRLGAVVDAAISGLRRSWAEFRRSPGDFFISLGKAPLLWALIAAFGLWQLRKVRFRRRDAAARAARPAGDPRLAELHRRYRRLLERHAGLRAQAAETDEELLARLAALDVVASAPARRFVELWRRARFGGAPLDEGELGRTVAEFERVLRESARTPGARSSGLS